MECIFSILYGIIEGITEWLPVSSTGHLILFEKFFQISPSESFMEMFRVVVQLGAIMAVVILYWSKLWPFHRKRSDIHWWKTKIDSPVFGGLQSFADKYVDMPKIILWLKILVACLPAALIGLIFDDKLDAAFYNFPTVSLMLIIYGILFIVVENRNAKRNIAKTKNLSVLTYKTAVIIGIFQLLALIPGTSRSGATILGAILIGCSREVAAEFSFFLAIPVMFGASLLKCVKFAAEVGSGEVMIGTNEILILIIGIVVSFIVSVFAIKFLVGYIKKNDFKFFGYYRIVLGAILLIYIAFAGV